MALFDFFKRDKGKEVFPQDADAQAKAEAIRKEIKSAGLADDLDVKVEGSSVRVLGTVPDPEARQKLMMMIGNIKGVEKVEDELGSSQQAGTQQQEAERPRVYEVQGGDTLSAIAKKEYGDANAYNRIFKANTPMLKDPDDIYPGQVLVIPEPSTAQA
jgi:nucleoid-associated protein YgaU